jgi:ABC-type uncharacterized transport system substrate-binding protein
LLIEFRWTERIERLSALAAELVHLKVDVIFAPSSTETGSARLATSTIPIIFAIHADPVGLGHVASLPRPGGNVTGLTVVQTDLTANLAELMLKHRLPSMFGVRDNVEAGGLMSYAPDHNDLTRRSATYIERILKGSKPADLPVEQASKYRLTINLKTAKALGIEVPPTLLARADEVIE